MRLLDYVFYGKFSWTIPSFSSLSCARSRLTVLSAKRVVSLFWPKSLFLPELRAKLFTKKSFFKHPASARLKTSSTLWRRISPNYLYLSRVQGRPSLHKITEGRRKLARIAKNPATFQSRFSRTTTKVQDARPRRSLDAPSLGALRPHENASSAIAVVEVDKSSRADASSLANVTLLGIDNHASSGEAIAASLKGSAEGEAVSKQVKHNTENCCQATQPQKGKFEPVIPHKK